MPLTPKARIVHHLWLPSALLSALLAPVVFAQESKPQGNGGALSYVGGTTRIGVGVDDDRKARGEIAQVFGETDTSAWVGELYGGRSGAGLKLSRGWVNGDWRTTDSNNLAVTKVFAAVDQNRDHDRKLTLGGGREWQNLFWNAYISGALTGKRDVSDVSRSTVESVSGLEGDRPFLQDVTTTVRTQTFARPYEWGVGTRAGRFFDGGLVRLTTGLDFEFGKSSAKQSTFSVGVEKFFYGTPFSVALSGEAYRKSGSFESKRSDTRGLLMFRWDLGGTPYRPTQQFKMVQVPKTITETVTEPAPAASSSSSGGGAGGTAAAPAGTIVDYKTEKVEKTVKRELGLVEGFPFKSSQLSAEQIAEVKKFAADIKASTCPVKVDVQGYACPYGREQGNLIVSTQRANLVRDLLVKEGIAPENINAQGLGGRNPKYDRADARNRRVEAQAVGGVCSVVTEEVKTPITAVAATPPPQTVTREVTKTVMEEKQEAVPVEPGWLRRALHTAPSHKQSVDTYTQVETSTSKALGPRVFQNRCVVATDDAATAAGGVATTIDVLANDTDPDGDKLTLESVSVPANGTATVSGGKVIYTPKAGFAGQDSFTYTVTDGKCSKTATVRVTVSATQPPAQGPVCNADRYVIPTRFLNNFNVLENDTTNAPPLRVVSVTQSPIPGSTVVINSDGTLSFNSPVAFPETTFTYTARDAAGGTCTGNVTIIDP